MFALLDFHMWPQLWNILSYFIRDQLLLYLGQCNKKEYPTKIVEVKRNAFETIFYRPYLVAVKQHNYLG